MDAKVRQLLDDISKSVADCSRLINSRKTDVDGFRSLARTLTLLGEALDIGVDVVILQDLNRK